MGTETRRLVRQERFDGGRVGFEPAGRLFCDPLEMLDLDLALGQTPGGDGATVDEGEGAEDAVVGDQALVGADDVVARGPTKQQRVEGAEQARRWDRRGLLAFAEVDEAVAEVDQPAGDRGEAGARVTQRQARPASEVGVGRRAVADEVAAREIGERRLAIDRGGSPSQSRTATKACSLPIIGPRTQTPWRAA